MFGLSKFQDYGLTIITGDFGAGKTKNVYQDAFLRKKQYPDGLLIANIPYDFVDLHFSSKSDLDIILIYLEKYVKDTNVPERMIPADYPKIRVIIDESHLYFFSRDFKAFSKSALLILTQCRKRSIQINFITQELAQLDVFMRRLMPYVMNYSKAIFGFVRATMYYFKVSEVSDIGDEVNVEEVESEILRPNRLMRKFNKELDQYFNQRFLTYYVIGANDVLTDFDYQNFANIVEEKADLYRQYLSSKLKDKNDVLTQIVDEEIDIQHRQYLSSKLKDKNDVLTQIVDEEINIQQQEVDIPKDIP